MRELKVFSGRANEGLASEICDFLNLPIGKIDLGTFPDGECKCKVMEDVRGRDVFLVQPTCPPVNDNLFELLIMIDSCKRASAARVTAVIPYFGYARQDRKDEGRTPITAKLVANLITRAGADRVLTMDLHAPQIQGFFDVPVDHLYAAPVLNDHIRAMNLPLDEVVVVSPDVGSIKRAVGHKKRLGDSVALAILDKRRESATKTVQEHVIGEDVEGKIAIMFDDMISTGGSICSAADLLHKRGARQILVAATHGIFCGNAVDNLNKTSVERLTTTNSIPLAPEKRLNSLEVLSVAPLLGEAIMRIHRDQSISAIFEDEKD